VSEVRDIAGSAPSGAEPPEVQHVLATARAVADEEFSRAERFDRKALNLATVVGAFYSLSQIVVVSALGSSTFEITGSTLDWIRWVGVGATVLAALAVAACLFVFRARREVAADLDRLQPWLAAAKRGNPEVTEQVILTYLEIAKDRRKSNGVRTTRYRQASWLALLAVTTTATELGIVLFAIT
jgi:hypothetical protein